MTLSYLFAGIRCRKKLWRMLHSDDKQEPDAIARNYKIQNKALLERYLLRFENYCLIAGKTPEDAYQQTVEAMRRGEKIIVGACLLADHYYVRVDILEKVGAAWRLIMVKAASGVKLRYLDTLSFQFHVCREAGITINAINIAFVNKRYKTGDDTDLFIVKKLFKAVSENLPEIQKQIFKIRAVLESPDCPEADIGRQCLKPAPCELYDECWKGISDYHIFTIPNMKPQHRKDLLRKGIVEISELPADMVWKESQRRYIDMVKNQSQQVDREALARVLSELEFPLYFLDFEADNPAIPRFEGQRAFMKIPFQFSCHRLSAQGVLEHTDYLHSGDDDPRPALIEALLACIGDKGSVIVWHAAFEKSRLHELAHFDSENRTCLTAITARLWDMEPIFERIFLDYRFRGSKSIKAVIPVLAPTLDYSDLNIKGGEHVVAAWNLMLHEEDADARESLFNDILVYCERDTLAMVEIYRYLSSMLTWTEQNP
jgi:hypothetical protein